MTKTVWLHIGAEKTGTTTIQATLGANRPLLKECGILYPQALGDRNQIKLTAYGLDDSKINDETRVLSGISPNGIAAFRANLNRSLQNEINQSGCDTIVMSNEHCSSRLRTVHEIERLKKLLDPITDDIRILLYIRNPADFIASWYSTTVTGGAVKPLDLPLSAAMLDKVRFRAMIELWEGVFTRPKIFVRRFERHRFVNGSLMTDFFSAIGREDVSVPEIEPKNQSLGIKALIFLRELNKYVPRIHNRELNQKRGQVVEALRLADNGPRYALPCAEAARIMTLLEPDHTHIAAEYFGGDNPLFTDATSVSEVSNDTGVLDFEDTVRFAAAIWTFARTQNIALGQQLVRLRKGERGGGGERF